MIVRELLTRLGFSLDQSQVNKAEQATQRIKFQAEQAAGAFRNVVAALVSFSAVKSIVGVADQMQDLRSRIGQLPQTVGDAGAALDEVAKHANKSGVSLEAYGALYTKVGHAAKDYIKTQADLIGITDTFSRALVVGGASAQESRAVMTQLAQALGSGVLQGDEFRSMAEAAPQFLDKLSEAMGIPREQLKKMAADGKLTSRAVIEATRKMADYFELRSKQIPFTIGRAIQVLADRFALMIDKINRESMFVTHVANGILAAMEKLGKGIEFLVDKFGGLGNMLRLVGITVGVALGTKALQILSAFRAATLLAMLPFLKIIAVITAVSLVVEDLYVWIKGGESLIGRWIGPWENWRDRVMGVINSVIKVLTGLQNILIGVFTFDLGQISKGLNQVGQVMWSILSAVFTSVAEFIYDHIVTPIIDAVKAALATIKELFIEPILAIGKFIYDAIFMGIVKGVQRAWEAVKGIFGGAVAGAASALGGVGAAGSAAGATAGGVSPSSLSWASMGAPRPNVVLNSPTNVTVTVPPGTTAEQAKFLQDSAQKSFGTAGDDKLARNLAIYAP